jgi:hypothetical protein
MRLWGRVGHAPDHIVAADRDFFLRKILGVMWPTTQNQRPLNRHPSGDGLVDAEIAAFDGFCNANSSTLGLPCTHAGGNGAPSARNADFVVIQTHLSHGLQRTCDN